MRSGSIAAAAGFGLLALLAQAGQAAAAELKVMATTSLKATLEKLGPQFERSSGHKLTFEFGTSAPLKRQIDAGQPFDLAILVPASLDALIKEGKIAADTRIDIARSAIGVAIRCDDCIAFHAKAAVQNGATRDEVLETLGMAVYMGAGPSVMYASHAIEAFDQFAQQEVAA